MDRYFLPFLPPIILVVAFGLTSLAVRNRGIGTIFAGAMLGTQCMTVVVFWNDLYARGAPTFSDHPQFATLQKYLIYTVGGFSTVLFLAVFAICVCFALEIG